MQCRPALVLARDGGGAEVGNEVQALGWLAHHMELRCGQQAGLSLQNLAPCLGAGEQFGGSTFPFDEQFAHFGMGIEIGLDAAKRHKLADHIDPVRPKSSCPRREACRSFA